MILRHLGSHRVDLKEEIGVWDRGHCGTGTHRVEIRQRLAGRIGHRRRVGEPALGVLETVGQTVMIDVGNRGS